MATFIEWVLVFLIGLFLIVSILVGLDIRKAEKEERQMVGKERK